MHSIRVYAACQYPVPACHGFVPRESLLPAEGARGQAKADHVRDLAAQRGYRLEDCYAYSDSVTDLPLLELVGRPHAVNPDRELRRVARMRGWPELAFSQTGG